MKMTKNEIINSLRSSALRGGLELTFQEHAEYFDYDGSMLAEAITESFPSLPEDYKAAMSLGILMGTALEKAKTNIEEANA